MPKAAFVGPLRKCCIDGCCKQVEFITAELCGMHAQRVRRYGDPNYLTPEDVRRANNRAAQMVVYPSIKGAYAKYHGRHEHRVVAERMLGRPLQRGEIVHHIDGNRRNNNPANLQVMTQSEHMRLHHAEMQAARKARHGY
jgi:hypothetical protein